MKNLINIFNLLLLLCVSYQATAQQRNIVFIHGLGGNEYSWDRMRDIHSKFFINNTSCQSNVWTRRQSDSRSITYSQQSLSGAGTDALTKTTQMLNQMRGNSQLNRNTDFIIAHSQGGIVARQMDYILMNNPNSRPFGGIITFGSPHSGAKVVNSIESGSVDLFFTNACNNAFAGPVREGTPDNLIMQIFGVPNKINALSNKVCQFVGGFLLPALGGELNQPIRSALAENSSELNTLNSYGHGVISKIAAYGVEDDPTLWRLANSFQTNLNTLPCFGANEDNQLVNVAQSKIQEAIDKINENDCTWIWCWNQKQKRAAWIKTRNWWMNANNEFKILTGSAQYVTSFANECLIQNYSYGNLESEYTVSAYSPSECDAYEYSGNSGWTDATPIYHQVLQSLPSDGIVTETSAKAFPGAYPMEMIGSNHQQMRNDSRTKNVLERAYFGDEVLYFKTDPK